MLEREPQRLLGHARRDSRSTPATHAAIACAPRRRPAALEPAGRHARHPERVRVRQRSRPARRARAEQRPRAAPPATRPSWRSARGLPPSARRRAARRPARARRTRGRARRPPGRRGGAGRSSRPSSSQPASLSASVQGGIRVRGGRARPPRVRRGVPRGDRRDGRPRTGGPPSSDLAAYSSQPRSRRAPESLSRDHAALDLRRPARDRCCPRSPGSAPPGDPRRPPRGRSTSARGPEQARARVGGPLDQRRRSRASPSTLPPPRAARRRAAPPHAGRAGAPPRPRRAAGAARAARRPSRAARLEVVEHPQHHAHLLARHALVVERAHQHPPAAVQLADELAGGHLDVRRGRPHTGRPPPTVAISRTSMPGERMSATSTETPRCGRDASGSVRTAR